MTIPEGCAHIKMLFMLVLSALICKVSHLTWHSSRDSSMGYGSFQKTALEGNSNPDISVFMNFVYGHHHH